MIRTLSRIRKDPDRARAHVRNMCYTASLRKNTFLDKASTFSGKNEMSYAELEYMLKCAEETRKKKTW